MEFKIDDEVLYNDDVYIVISKENGEIGISRMYGLAEGKNMSKCEAIKFKYVSPNDIKLLKKR